VSVRAPTSTVTMIPPQPEANKPGRVFSSLDHLREIGLACHLLSERARFLVYTDNRHGDLQVMLSACRRLESHLMVILDSEEDFTDASAKFDEARKFVMAELLALSLLLLSSNNRVIRLVPHSAILPRLQALAEDGELHRLTDEELLARLREVISTDEVLNARSANARKRKPVKKKREER